ncbi:MAG: transglutaminase family protein [Hyphomicrobiales bacterium]|nr:transglutaminase family protein [Hyphomicrobiales bacterium]
MIYDIRHITTYLYENAVGSARCALRLAPRVTREQIVLDRGLEIAPHPHGLRATQDFFGNAVSSFRIDNPHRELRIAALSRVEVRRSPQPYGELTPTWEEIRASAASSRLLGPASPAHFLYPTAMTPLYAPATAYAAQSFSPGRPILSAAIDLMGRIHRDFRFDPTATDVATPLAQAFEQRGGVCQDFAHIMIAAMRGLGLPAAYVSGYIRTIPPEGQPRLEGADASHAWAQVWCGPAGWLGLDPTNNLQINDDFIETAIGRDYADVAPVSGVLHASGAQDVRAAVDVIPVG